MSISAAPLPPKQAAFKNTTAMRFATAKAPTESAELPSSGPSSAVKMPPDSNTAMSKDHEHPADLGPATLSARGAAHAASQSPFWTVFDDMLRDVYCAQTNPRGIINMGIANNSLMESELLEYFHTHLQLGPTDLTYGTSLYGSTRLFEALAKHYNNGAVFAPVHRVTPSQILTSVGCGPMLDQIFSHIADAGDVCLAAAPYYNGFDADLAIRSGVKCVPVYSPYGDGTEDASFTGETCLRGFEDAIREHENARAILVCNPHNPAGRCYDREALLAYGRFAQRHDLHLVFDEIYAMSTFATSDVPDPQPFISALNIDWPREAACHPSRIHILSSASKDFGLNGFRIGTFISQFNKDLFAAMKTTAKLYMVSAPADALFSALLNDEDFYPRFVDTNRRRLAEAYEVAKTWCQKHRIPYKPANAGHFILVDLSAFCTDAMQLWATALNHRVCITPASNYHLLRDGWFRITFSLQQEILQEGFARLEQALDLASQSNRDPPISGTAEKSTSLRLDLSPKSLAVYTALCGSRVDDQDDDRTDLPTSRRRNIDQPQDMAVALLTAATNTACLC